MRILLVTNGLPANDPGGVQYYTLSLAHQLAKKHQVSIFARVWDIGKPEYHTNEYRLGSISVFSVVKNIGYPADFRLSYIDEKIDVIFRDFLEKARPDIVHIQHLIFLSANIINIIAQRNIPIVLTLHDFWYICPAIRLLTPEMKLCPCLLRSAYGARCYHNHFYISQATTPVFSKIPPQLKKIFPQFLKEAIKNILRLREPDFQQNAGLTKVEHELGQSRTDFMHNILDKVSMIIAPSLFVRDQYQKWGLIHSVEVIPHGIDVKHYTKDKRRKNDHIRFGYIGTVYKFKGVDVLIQAFMKVSGNKNRLDIYGDYRAASQYCRSLKKMIKHDKRIHFHGAYDNNQLEGILSKIDIVVVPTLCYESFNIVIREAFAYKTPVIASRIGAIPEIVKDGQNGILFEAGNITQLTAKMQSVVTESSKISQFENKIPIIKDITHHAEEIEERYRKILVKKK